MLITELWLHFWTFTSSWWSSSILNSTQASGWSIHLSKVKHQHTKATLLRRLLLKILMMMRNINLTSNLLISTNKMNIFFSMDFISIWALKSHDIRLNISFFPMEELFHWLKIMPISLTSLLTERTSSKKRPRSTFNHNGCMIQLTLRNFWTLSNTGSEK